MPEVRFREGQTRQVFRGAGDESDAAEVVQLGELLFCCICQVLLPACLAKLVSFGSALCQVKPPTLRQIEPPTSPSAYVRTRLRGTLAWPSVCGFI